MEAKARGVACLCALRAPPARALPLPSMCSASGLLASGRGLRLAAAWRAMAAEHPASVIA